jgi:hypothetical protein
LVNGTPLPSPGAYVAATVEDTSCEVPAPVCEACVERHYPERVADVEADRLHYWTN